METFVEVSFGRTGVDPGDRHGWSRRHVVRVDDLEQPFRELRELRVDLDLGAGGHEAERLDQPFDVGIRDLARLHSQARRDLWMLPPKLAGELAHVDQFVVVVFKQSWIHGIASYLLRFRWRERRGR